jgi:hypothetical protein
MLAPLDTLPAWVPGQPTLGWTMLRWFLGESAPGVPRFSTVDGPRAGQPLALTERQMLTVLWWYAVAPDGLWLYRGGMSRHVRGAGKSPLGALLALGDFVGPARPVFTNTGELVTARPGELAGQPVSMPLVQIAAVSEAQTENTFRFVLAWAGAGTPLANEYGLDVGKTQLTSPNRGPTRGGVLKIVASSSQTIRGSRPTLVIGDELGEWAPNNGGTRFHAVIEDNATKVPYARIYGLGNAWEPGGDSVGESLWDGWEAERAAVAAGAVEHPFLMDVREAPADMDWSDPESIRAGLAVVYDGIPWVDQRQVLTKVLDPRKPLSESQREFGNWRVAAEDAWTTAQDVERNRLADAELLPGEAVTLGLDPSDTDDSTVLTVTRMSDGYTDVLWSHEPSRAGRPTDWTEADAAVQAAHELYDVVAFFADVNPAEHYVKSVWPERYARGYDVPGVGDERGRPLHRDGYCVEAATGEPVAFDNRRHRLKMLQATELALDELTRGAWPHSGHPVLERHLLNAHRRPTVGYVGIRKASNDRKIDAAISAIMSRHARRMVLESSAWAERTEEKFSWVM